MNRIKYLVLAVLCLGFAVAMQSCKSCNKEKPVTTTADSTTANTLNPNSGTLTLPHADTSLIPMLGATLDTVFDASAKKDYKTMAGYIIYRGPDSLRYFADVFSVKTAYERDVLRITADAFNKWNKNIESRDYNRIYNVPLPDGNAMPFLEVLFISPKNTTRKFFGFFPSENGFKIAEVTSTL